jgi:hypothetical protein
MKVGDGTDCKSALCPVAGNTGRVELSVSDKRRAIQQAPDELRNCAWLNNMSLWYTISHVTRVGAHRLWEGPWKCIMSEPDLKAAASSSSTWLCANKEKQLNLQMYHSNSCQDCTLHRYVPISFFIISNLTLILLMWKIRSAPNNATKWQMGFNSAFKGLISGVVIKVNQEPVWRASPIYHHLTPPPKWI